MKEVTKDKENKGSNSKGSDFQCDPPGLKRAAAAAEELNVSSHANAGQEKIKQKEAERDLAQQRQLLIK